MIKVGDYVEYTGDTTAAWKGRRGWVVKIRDEWADVRCDGKDVLSMWHRNLTLIHSVVPLVTQTAVPEGWKVEIRAHVPRNPTSLPEDSAERKTYPLASGLLDYFPAALAAVAHHSHKGNEKHNPGQPLHWSRGKSADHLDAAMRHIMERDLEGAAWRILAALQMQLESEGAPVAIGARIPTQGT